MDDRAIINTDEPSAIADRKYHTDPGCEDAKRIHWSETVPLSSVPDEYRECRRCSGDRLPYGFETEPGKCMVCHAELDEDGHCAFCEAFDAVHDLNP